MFLPKANMDRNARPDPGSGCGGDTPISVGEPVGSMDPSM